MTSLKKSILTGTLWSAGGQLMSMLVLLISNIWLARLLTPKDFGQVGIIMFFIMLANVLSESGLGGALVRKKNSTKADYSTVFVANLVLSVFCFIIIFLSAGFVANYYKDVSLKNLLIVSSLVLIINAFQLTQNAKLVSEMKFKQKSIYRFIAVLISSIIGIYFAYQGLGVWALVMIQLLTAGINTILLWVFEGFFLNLHFSKTSFKELYAFGMNTTLASLLNTGFDNVYQLVLAKHFALSETGYFYQAKKLQDVPGGIINLVTQSVIFSSLAKLQDDKLAFTKVYNKITLYFIAVLGFVSIFVYVYAETIVLLLYGQKWIGTVFYLQLLIIASFFSIQESINRVIFKVFNKTHQILYLEYFKKFIQAVSIVIGIYYLDLKILIIGYVLANIIGYLINYYFSRKIIGSVSSYELFTLLKVVLISVLCVIITLFVARGINLTGYGMFIVFPLLLLLYFCGMSLFKVMNLKKEISSIRDLFC